jgi:hypothetical protein
MIGCCGRGLRRPWRLDVDRRLRGWRRSGRGEPVVPQPRYGLSWLGGPRPRHRRVHRADAGPRRRGQHRCAGAPASTDRPAPSAGDHHDGRQRPARRLRRQHGRPVRHRPGGGDRRGDPESAAPLAADCRIVVTTVYDPRRRWRRGSPPRPTRSCRTRRGSSTTRTAGSADSPPASPPTPPGGRAP